MLTTILEQSNVFYLPIINGINCSGLLKKTYSGQINQENCHLNYPSQITVEFSPSLQLTHFSINNNLASHVSHACKFFWWVWPFSLEDHPFFRIIPKESLHRSSKLFFTVLFIFHPFLQPNSALTYWNL